MGFVIDCHDREVLAHVAAPRSLTGADIRPLMERSLWKRFGEATLKTPHPVQWLSDNGPQDADSLLLQLEGWIEDYNTRAPHSALGMRSPAEYRTELQSSSSGV